jgi:hypothetical protein
MYLHYLPTNQSTNLFIAYLFVKMFESTKQVTQSSGKTFVTEVVVGVT